MNAHVDKPDVARAKVRAANISFAATIGLLVAKGAAAWITGSLTILAILFDAVFDVAANTITMISVRLSSRPPDSEHPYGHVKIESVSALGELAVIVGGLAFIVVTAIRRLAAGAAPPQDLGWGLGLLALMFLTDTIRSTYLFRVARRFGSHALEADALNFRGDMLTASVALASIVTTMLGLRWADAVGSLAVCAIITYSATRLARSAIDALMDRAPMDFIARADAAIMSVRGVVWVGGFRLRGAPGAYFGDVMVGIDASMPFGEAHAVSDEIEKTVARAIPNLDLTVHVEPAARDSSPEAIVYAEAAAESADIHHVVVDSRQDGTFEVYFHQMLRAGVALSEAHAAVSRLEKKVLERLPPGSTVHAHIEEMTVSAHDGEASSLDGLSEVAQFAAVQCCGDAVSRVHVTGNLQAPRVAVHLVLDPDMPVEKAHRTAEAVEHAVRAAIPNAARIAVTTEPKR